MNRKSLILGFLICAALSADLTGEWTVLYPLPQGADLSWIQILGSNTVVAAGEDGAMILTTDQGKTWLVRDLTEGLQYLKHLYDIQILDNGSGWASITKSVIKTTDYGITWQSKLNTAATITSLTATHPDTCWIVANGNILLRTENGGDRWEVLSSRWLFELSFIDNRFGWAMDYENLLRTTDGGRSWNILCDQPDGIEKIDFQDNGFGWAFGDNGTMLISRDSGETWSHVTTFTSSEIHSVVFLDTLGWALADGLYASSDRGEHWSLMQRWRIPVSGLSVRGQEIWVAGENGFLAWSLDRGGTWDNNMPLGDVYFESVSFVDEQNGWIAGTRRDGGLFRTTDGGKNWSRDERFESAVQVLFTSQDTGFFVDGSYRPYRTVDSGLQWEQLDYPEKVSSLYFLNNRTGWALYFWNDLYRTSDGGETWKKVTMNQQHCYQDLHFVNANEGWIVGTNEHFDCGVLMKTTDGGASWLSFDAPGSYGLSAVAFINTQKGFVAGYQGIYRTLNGGMQWSLVLATSGQITDIQFLDAMNGWAYDSGWEGTMMRTSDGGSHWFAEPTPNAHDLICMNWISGDLGYAVSGHEIIRYESESSTPVDDPMESSKETGSLDLTNYPNPFNAETRIRFHLNSSSRVVLNIFNILGQAVFEWKAALPAGDQEILWKPKAMPSGIYLCRLSTESTVDVHKLILQE